MSMQRVDNDILAGIYCSACGFECSQVSVFGYLLYQDVFLQKSILMTMLATTIGQVR